jgi:AcrR family transcriptional regulator
MVKSSDTRATSRNRRRIQEAFAELLAERGSLSNVTVTDLAERAEITRGTFYNYYDNLYEVGAELQGELEKQIFSEYDNLATLEAIENYIDDVFLFFEKQEEIYRELIVSDASQSF